MKCGKGHGHNDPVLIGIYPVDQDDQDGNDEVQEQQTPTFPDLDQELTKIALDIPAADDKRDQYPDHAQRDPDGGRKGRYSKNDVRDDIGPFPMTAQVEKKKEEIIGKGESEQTDKPFADTKGAHRQQRKEHQQEEGHSRDIQEGNDAGPASDVKDRGPGMLAVVQLHHPVPDPDHDRIDEQRGGKMTPVRQEGSDQDIGHPREIIGLWQHLMVVADPVEQGGLAYQEQEGQQGIKDGRIVTDTVEAMKDHPVEIIVFGMQLRRHRVKEQGKLQHKCIKQENKRIGRGFLSEDADHMVCFGLLEINLCKVRVFSALSTGNQPLQSTNNFCKDTE